MIKKQQHQRKHLTYMQILSLYMSLYKRGSTRIHEKARLLVTECSHKLKNIRVREKRHALKVIKKSASRLIHHINSSSFPSMMNAKRRRQGRKCRSTVHNFGSPGLFSSRGNFGVNILHNFGSPGLNSPRGVPGLNSPRGVNMLFGENNNIFKR